MPARQHNKDLFADSTMTFGDHLEELRSCLFKSLIALAVGSIVGLIPFVGGNVVALIQTPLERALSEYYETQTTQQAQQAVAADQPDGELPEDEATRIAKFVADNHLLMEQILVNPDWVIHELRRHDLERFGSLPAADEQSGGAAAVPQSKDDLVPLIIFRPTKDDSRVRAKSLGAHEAFIIYVKASLLVGVLLASPYIFYQIWSFVASGLYPHEQRYVRVFLPFSLGLFFAGAATAFFFVFEPVLNFLFSFNRTLGIDIEPRITEWLSFVLILPLGFGISFQLPLVMLFLERIGVFDVKAYLTKWRVAILVILILSMFLTPGDPYSMLLMAVPLIVLYFGGVLLCKFMPRRRSLFDEE